jgi:hypothetical protein
MSNTARRGTDAHEATSFRIRDALICHSMGHLLHGEQPLFDQRVILRVSCVYK